MILGIAIGFGSAALIAVLIFLGWVSTKFDS